MRHHHPIKRLRLCWIGTIIIVVGLSGWGSSIVPLAQPIGGETSPIRPPAETDQPDAGPWIEEPVAPCLEQEAVEEWVEEEPAEEWTDEETVEEWVEEPAGPWVEEPADPWTEEEAAQEEAEAEAVEEWAEEPTGPWAEEEPAEIWVEEPFGIDLTPPPVTHTLAGVQTFPGRYTPPVTLTLTGQDDLSGFAHYEINLDNKGWLILPTSSYRITAAGYHTLCYRAVDQAGQPSRAEGLTLFIEKENKIYLPLIFEHNGGKN